VRLLAAVALLWAATVANFAGYPIVSFPALAAAAALFVIGGRRLNRAAPTTDVPVTREDSTA
jgi:uncharacterized membrane protein